MSDYLHSICLGDYLTELPKSMLPASHAEDNGAYPFYCSSSIPKSSPTWLQDKSAILMGTGGIASVHLGHGHYAYSTDTWAFRINSDKLNVEYAYRLLHLQLNKIDYLGFEGSGLRHLRKGFIKNLIFSVPADEQQKKIATILTSIDTAIEKTEALIQKYQQIKAGLMHDLFTRGVTVDGKLRPPRDLAPELYQETPAGLIPQEWGVFTLKDKEIPGVLHLRTGPFGSSLKGEHWVKVGHPVITIGSLGEGCLIESELLYVNDADARRLFEFQLKIGDVIFSRVADVGRSAVIKQDHSGWIMSSNLMRISLDRSQIIPEFLQQQLSYNFSVKKQIRQKVNSGGREVANSDILNQLKFSCPEPDEQKIIVERAQAIDLRIRSENSLRRKLEKQKQGLMQDLLTGKVRVKLDEPETANV